MGLLYTFNGERESDEGCCGACRHPRSHQRCAGRVELHQPLHPAMARCAAAARAMGRSPAPPHGEGAVKEAVRRAGCGATLLLPSTSNFSPCYHGRRGEGGRERAEEMDGSAVVPAAAAARNGLEEEGTRVDDRIGHTRLGFSPWLVLFICWTSAMARACCRSCLSRPPPM
jgi:hypothetical protein